MPPKRKADTDLSPTGGTPAAKKPNTKAFAKPTRSPKSDLAEKYGIVHRTFYPPEISNERCAQYDNNVIPRPIEELQTALKETERQRKDIQVGDAVVHWFKRDLRTHDNKALSMAGELAREKGVPLVGVFIVSPQDYEAHWTSSCKVDFELRSLAVLKEDLAQLNIPLVVDRVDKRRSIPDHIINLCQTWRARHVFCGIEYEVDELRREKLMTKKCLEKGVSFNPFHDDVVVAPGELSTGTGRQYAVYSPWYRAWMKHIHTHPYVLNEFKPPSPNPTTTREKFKSLFDSSIPDPPSNKALSVEEKERFKSVWPAGEHEAIERLQKFLRERVGKYKDARNLPALNSTALLSVHFAAGTLSARTAVRNAREANSSKSLDSGNGGIVSWISEVAWRDFYKHILAHWPYICMNKAFKYELTDLKWSYNMEHFERWKKGETGFPIVDAAMRQALYMGYIHNRCRMIVASFLTKDLCLDWRMGEKYFMSALIDGDFASNSGGWGFSSSTGADGNPYFRIFNPLLQSEKFDADGEYIRKWIPELSNIKGKAIHDPYGRGAGKEAEKAGYPRPIVKHEEQRKKALDMFKEKGN